MRMGNSLLPRLMAWAILFLGILAIPTIGTNMNDVQQGEANDALTSANAANLEARAVNWHAGICYFQATMRQTCYFDTTSSTIKYRQELAIPAIFDQMGEVATKVNLGQWFEIRYLPVVSVDLGGRLEFLRYPSSESNGPAMFKYRDYEWTTRTSHDHPGGGCIWGEPSGPTTCTKNNAPEWLHFSGGTCYFRCGMGPA